MTDPMSAWVLPGEPVPVRFMNTIWADTGGIHDDLSSPAALGEWISVVDHREVGELGDPTPQEFTEARQLRDALRRLAAFSTGDPRPAAQSAIVTVDEALAVVNDAFAHRLGTRLTLRDGQLHTDRPPRASPTRTALAEIAAGAINQLTAPAAPQLRACHAPGCVLYFVKSHPRREWCSEACGNRTRAARHYQRIRTQKHQ